MEFSAFIVIKYYILHLWELCETNPQNEMPHLCHFFHVGSIINFSPMILLCNQGLFCQSRKNSVMEKQCSDFNEQCSCPLNILSYATLLKKELM